MNKTETEEKMLKVQHERGRIATNFAFIEMLIGQVISAHYFSKNEEEFTADVIEDEYFNFGLRLRIFEKIISKTGNNFPIEKLRKLSKLRNIIIHSQIKAGGMLNRNTNLVKDVDKIWFRHAGKEYNQDDLFKDYDILSSEVANLIKGINGGEHQKLDLLD